MSWADLLAVIRDEAGVELADRIEARCKREIQGLRVTVPSRPHLTNDEIDRALRQAGYSVARAAKRLRVSVSTIYRALNGRLERPKPPPPKTIR